MKTCVSIINPNHIPKANKTSADFLELRMDLYPKADINKLIAKCQKPVILKITNKKQINYNAKYIDIDYRSYDRVHLGQKNLIISYHNFKKTPDFKFLDNLVKKGVNKIATKINRVEDNLIIAKLLEKYPNKIIAIGMGELGLMTRLDKRQKISYFALDEKLKSAPGQVTLDKKDVKLLGIIGNPAKQSSSPQLHNPAFKKKKAELPLSNLGS